MYELYYSFTTYGVLLFNFLRPNGRNLWLHYIAFNNDLVIYMVILFKISKLATSGLFGLDS